MKKLFLAALISVLVLSCAKEEQPSVTESKDANRITTDPAT
jgi:hypothetical protein